MITFKAKKLALSPGGYALILPGNGGEELLTMFMSWGQDQKSQLVIVSAQCDGNIRVLVVAGKRMNLANVLATIDRAIEKWSLQGGIKPTEPERAYLVKQRQKVLDKIANYCETGALK